jgi:hypothetical protein
MACAAEQRVLRQLAIKTACRCALLTGAQGATSFAKFAAQLLTGERDITGHERGLIH